MFSSSSSAKKLKQMLFEGSALNEEIQAEVDEVCPSTPVDCSTRDLTFRPIDELCNNLLQPTIGNPDTAQLRLAPAFFENCKWKTDQR